MTLTKAEIVESIHTQLKFSKIKSTELIETVLELMKKALASGDDVLISGFGKFCAKAKRARRGRNPATGNSMILDARKVVIFKCSGKLRDTVNGK